MLLATKRFKHRARPGGLSWWMPGKAGGCPICDYHLKQRFAIPNDVKVIWISLYDRASKYRWPAKVVSQGVGQRIAVGAHQGIAATGVSAIRRDRLLKPLVGRNVWIEVEY